eukprot:9639411-Lingulodinium_polyedra.AAC.1
MLIKTPGSEVVLYNSKTTEAPLVPPIRPTEERVVLDKATYGDNIVLKFSSGWGFLEFANHEVKWIKGLFKKVLYRRLHDGREFMKVSGKAVWLDNVVVSFLKLTVAMNIFSGARFPIILFDHAQQNLGHIFWEMKYFQEPPVLVSALCCSPAFNC